MNTSFLSRAAAIVSSIALVAAVTVVPSYAAGVSSTAVGTTAGFTVTLGGNMTALPQNGYAIVSLYSVNTTTGVRTQVDISGATAVLPDIANPTESAFATKSLKVLADAVGGSTLDAAEQVVVTTVLADDTVYNAQITTYDATNAALATGNTSVLFGVGNSTNKVTVNATVEPSVSLVVTGNTVELGTLTPGSITSSAAAATNLALTTNVSTGATVSASDTDSHVGLWDTVTSTLIPAANTVAAGTAGFDINASGNTGTAVIATNFNDGAVQANDVALMANAQTLFTTSGASVGAVDVQYLGAVAATTPAGAYTTSVTYTATGNF